MSHHTYTPPSKWARYNPQRLQRAYYADALADLHHRIDNSMALQSLDTLVAEVAAQHDMPPDTLRDLHLSEQPA